MTASSPTAKKVSMARRKIPKEIIQLFESDIEYIHVFGDDRPDGTMVFPLDALAKMSKLNPKVLSNLEANYDIVLMPKIR